MWGFHILVNYVSAKFLYVISQSHSLLLGFLFELHALNRFQVSGSSSDALIIVGLEFVQHRGHCALPLVSLPGHAKALCTCRGQQQIGNKLVKNTECLL